MTLLRHPVTPSDFKRGYDDSTVNAACNTLYGIGDLTYVEDAMVERFARVLERVEDKDKGTAITVLSGFNSLVDKATQAAIRSGQFEIVRLQLFDNIVGATATLFSEGAKYEYDNETAEETISEIRAKSGASLSELRWDSVAVGVGSSVLYCEVKGEKLVETEVRPTSMWVIFAESINDNGKDRATDTMNIDEASVVVMQLSGAEKYAAWFGPSDLYPIGRHVIYTAKKFSDIPAPEDKEGKEYTIQQEYSEHTVGVEMLANPLSLWAIKGKATPPVYPFSVLYGSPLSRGLIPTSASLYKTGLEVDLAASLIMGAAGRGARGAQTLTDDGNGDPSDVPSNTSEGLIMVGRGKDLNFTGWSPTHAKAAMDVISDQAKKIAESNHVPGYLAVSNDSAAPPSGIAIRRLNEPRTDYRRLRIEMNRASVRRRWEIEKALINASMDTESIPEETTEVWGAGQIEFAVDPAERLTEWEQRIKIGEASMLDVIQDMRGFSNANDAIAWATDRKALLDEHKELLDSFKPATAAAPATARGSLFNRG